MPSRHFLSGGLDNTDPTCCGKSINFRSVTMAISASNGGRHIWIIAAIWRNFRILTIITG